MKKYLITGFSGFVAKHFLDYLDKNVVSSQVLGIDVIINNFQSSEYKNIKINFQKIDLLEKDEIENIIYQFQPDYILHLASYSSVAFSWQEPILSFKNNTNIFLNLLEAVRKLKLKSRIISVGSSEEYGIVNEKDLPLTEETPLNPISPYAVARVSQEMLSKIYVNGYGLDIVLTRSFNHVGPGQKDIFVISSFVKQMVEIKKNISKENRIIVGDTSIIRDFLDVRDVVYAYNLLFQKGKSGEIYNICSSKGISLKEIIELIAEMLKIDIEIKIDKNLIRPSDNKIIIGSNDKIKKEISWENKIPLEKSLRDLINYWNNQ